MLLSRRAALSARVDSVTASGLRDAHELAEIDAALARLLQGSYGHCESCSGQIGRQQLRARPEVRRCLQCETF